MLPQGVILLLGGDTFGVEVDACVVAVFSFVGKYLRDMELFLCDNAGQVGHDCSFIKCAVAPGVTAKRKNIVRWLFGPMRAEEHVCPFSMLLPQCVIGQVQTILEDAQTTIFPLSKWGKDTTVSKGIVWHSSEDVRHGAVVYVFVEKLNPKHFS